MTNDIGVDSTDDQLRTISQSYLVSLESSDSNYGTGHTLNSIRILHAAKDACQRSRPRIHGVSHTATIPTPRQDRRIELGYLPSRIIFPEPRCSHMHLQTTLRSSRSSSTCCSLLPATPASDENISIVILAGVDVGLEKTMPNFTTRCIPNILSRVQSPTTAQSLRLSRGANRRLATGGHYVIPKPFNEPNVSVGLRA